MLVGNVLSDVGKSTFTHPRGAIQQNGEREKLKPARREQLFNADYAGALVLYRRAIEHLALYVLSWLGLVELYNDLGRRNRVVAGLCFVQGSSPDNEGTVWFRAIHVHELDQVRIMIAKFSALGMLVRIPAGQRQAGGSPAASARRNCSFPRPR